MNKTKIIATIGPSSQDEKILRNLILSGVDIIRLNLVYSNRTFCDEMIEKINKINKELNRFVSIMLDLEGPRLKTGKFKEGSISLKKEDKIQIHKQEILGDVTKFSVNYEKIVEEVKSGTLLKINDGLVELEVIENEPDFLVCSVVKEGIINDFSSIHIPGIHLSIPFISKKDREDILYACEKKVDFLALSHVTSSEDVLEVNDLLIELENDHMGILSKIENESAWNDIDEIIKVSEGIIVARGDLGIDLPIERVPGIQKMVINKCHRMGKASVVATELVSSMQTIPRPTRAEVSDIANAVLDGTDAVLLTGETTIGKYPMETVSMIEKVMKAAEEDLNYLELLDQAMRTEKQDTTGVLAYSVAEAANRLKCKAIVTPTISGFTAKKISRFRPMCPILAISPNIETVKNLSIYFGIQGVFIDELNSFDKVLTKASEVAKKWLTTETKDKIIITGGYPFKETKHTNFMKIEEI